MGGCLRSAAYSIAGGSCDLTITKGKKVDGSLVWALTSGGSNNDRIRKIIVMPGTNIVFWLVGSVSSASYSSQAGTAEMFISKHLTSTGALIAFNVLMKLSGTYQSFLTSGHLVNSERGAHLVLLGQSSEDLRFSYQNT